MKMVNKEETKIKLDKDKKNTMCVSMFIYI